MSVRRPSTLTVNLDNYAANLEVVHKYLPEGCSILAVVKADAYGLGAVPIAQRALHEGVAILGVASVAEGVELRAAGITAPILVLVQCALEELPLVVRNDLSLAVSDVDTTAELGDIARRAKAVASVHCEIDTGMGRQGFNTERGARDIVKITHISNVDIQGVFTHLASASSPDDPFTENQIRAFRHLVREVDKDGIPYEMLHAANSGAVVNYPQAAFDMVRVGLMTYGVWPSDAPPETSALKPVASWTTRVALIRDLPGGASISYGRTYRTSGPVRIAAIPVGYADGYRLGLSNRSDVLVRGVRCPVRGQVTMNEMLVDVTKVPEAVAGDKVTLIGVDGKERITAEELAGKAETIPYELLTGIGQSVDRAYVP